MQEKKALPPALKTILVPVVSAAAAVAVTLGVVTVINNGKESGQQANVVSETSNRVGYAVEGVTVVDDENALAKAVEEAVRSSQQGITLSFKNDAFSNDGQTFSCYLANAEQNEYDAYIEIFADDTLEEQIFLSQLLRPGTAFDTITLNRALDVGNHEVVVVFTQIEEVDGQQGFHGQTLFTMNFHVRAPE